MPQAELHEPDVTTGASVVSCDAPPGFGHVRLLGEDLPSNLVPFAPQVTGHRSPIRHEQPLSSMDIFGCDKLYLVSPEGEAQVAFFSVFSAWAVHEQGGVCLRFFPCAGWLVFFSFCSLEQKALPGWDVSLQDKSQSREVEEDSSFRTLEAPPSLHSIPLDSLLYASYPPERSCDPSQVPSLCKNMKERRRFVSYILTTDMLRRYIFSLTDGFRSHFIHGVGQLLAVVRR